MQELKAQISQNEAAITSERKTEQMALSSLGQSLYESELGKNYPESEKITEINQEISELEDFHEKLRTNTELEQQLADNLKTSNTEQKAIKKEMQSNLSILGREAWDYWKLGGSFSESEEILAQLIKEDKRLQNMDTAVSSIRQIDSKVGKTLFSKGRDAFMGSRRKLIEMSMNRLWEPAGKQILERVSWDEFKGTQVEPVATKIHSLQKKDEENQHRIEELRLEKNTLETNLESFPGKGSYSRRLSWIELEMESKRSILDDAYRQLSKVWLKSKEKAIPNEEVEKRNSRWVEITAKIKNLEKDKHVLELQLEQRKTQLEREKKATTVKEIEKKISDLQTKLKSEKKELDDIEKKEAKIQKSLL